MAWDWKKDAALQYLVHQSQIIKFTGCDSMKIFALSLLCLASMNAHADAGTELLKQVDDVTQRATVFYQWYIQEAADLKNPANNPEIEKYVATSLRKTLKS